MSKANCQYFSRHHYHYLLLGRAQLSGQEEVVEDSGNSEDSSEEEDAGVSQGTVDDGYLEWVVEVVIGHSGAGVLGE